MFSWEPDDTYDVVFFAFWLSHVPEDHMYRFWHNVHAALRPGGRFFLADNARIRVASVTKLPGVAIDGNVVHHGSGELDLVASSDLRRLEDGRRFRIVKRSFEVNVLANDLLEHGFHARFVETDEFFLYGSGTRL
jgi:SAM-dependent methyltransferase